MKQQKLFMVNNTEQMFWITNSMILQLRYVNPINADMFVVEAMALGASAL